MSTFISARSTSASVLATDELLLGRGTLLGLLLELVVEVFNDFRGRRIADLGIHAPDVGPLAGVLDDHAIAHVDLQLVGDDLDGATRDLDRVHHAHLRGAGRGADHRARGSTDGGVAAALVTRRTTGNRDRRSRRPWRPWWSCHPKDRLFRISPRHRAESTRTGPFSAPRPARR